jgi:MFS family permease
MNSGLLRRNRHFRYLWIAKTGSIFGDWFNQVALAQVTLQLTHSAASMGLVLLCRTLPVVLLGPFAGPLIDRFSKKSVMLWSDLLRALFAPVFGAAFLLQQEWMLYAGGILLGVSGILFNPAENAVLPLVVGREDLAEANAIRSGTHGIVGILGALGGGVIASVFNPVYCFLLNAVSYLWSAFFLYRARWKEEVQETGSVPFLRSLREGLEETARNRPARAIILIGISWGIAGGGYYILIPLLGSDIYQLGGSGIGLLYAIDGFGVLTGAYLVRRFISSRHRRAVISYGAAYVLQAIFFCLLTQSESFWPGAVMLFLMRVSSGLIIPLDTYLLQSHTPEAVRGRVFALHESTYLGVMQLSYVLFGTAFQHFGVQRVGLGIGLISLLCGLYWLYGVRRAEREANAFSGL